MHGFLAFFVGSLGLFACFHSQDPAGRGHDANIGREVNDNSASPAEVHSPKPACSIRVYRTGVLYVWYRFRI